MRVPEEYLPLLRSRQTKEQRIALAMLAKLNPARAREQRLPHQWRGESRTFCNYKLPLEEDDRTQDIHELKSKGVSTILAEHIHDGRLLQRGGERFLAGTLEEDPALLLAGSIELGNIEKEEEVLNDLHVYHRAAAEYLKALLRHRQWVQLENVTPLGAHVACSEGSPHKYLYEQFKETFASSMKHQFFVEYDTQASAYHFFTGKAIIEGIPAETDDPQLLLLYTAVHAKFSKDESCQMKKAENSSDGKTTENQITSPKTSIPSLT